MKAITQDRYGPPDVLEFCDVDPPTAADNEILVRVQAASVNAADWHIMRGDPYLARVLMPAVFGRRGPKHKIRGRDFAGRVAAAGKGVERFQVGDEVYGETEFASGTFAEYVCVPDDHVDPKPANLTFEAAAAAPLAGLTALIGLRDIGRVQPGERVLINGASGGVGTFAVQIAKSYGADVTAVCSTRNLELVHSLGADQLIDYTREDFARNQRRYDVVFDLVGNRPLSAHRRALTPAGTLVLSGGGVSRGGSLVGPMGLSIRAQLLDRVVRQRLVQLSEKPSQQNLTALRELIETGRVTPIIDRTYALNEVPEAIRYVEQEHARAKVVITI
jgi:NADPH:quinone reductase-like Zn-dependent oxidoreductase